MGLEHLKIGRARYRVEYKDLPTLYGQILFDSRCIQLADDLADEEAAYGVLHEMLHGIWEQGAIPPRAREERVVTTLAWGLTAVFRDNPGLLGHLDKLLTESR
ncbi:MAG: hypothetical protein ACHQAZ_00385 [Gammaproteobacteria bacterium]